MIIFKVYMSLLLLSYV